MFSLNRKDLVQQTIRKVLWAEERWQIINPIKSSKKITASPYGALAILLYIISTTAQKHRWHLF